MVLGPGRSQRRPRPVEHIAGPRTEEQWQDYLGALDCRFTAEDEALIDRLVTPGHPSTPGYNDPQYPIEGRPVRSTARAEGIARERVYEASASAGRQALHFYGASFDMRPAGASSG